MEFDSLSNIIIGFAITVHQTLGPGLFESAYESGMAYELTHHGLHIERQKAMPLKYKGIRLDCGYRIDMVVERQIVIEFKAVGKYDPVFMTQMLTYLKLSECKVGLILDFNYASMREGIKRVVL